MKTPIKKPAAAPSSHSSLWAKLPSSHVVNRWINELARLPSHSTDPDQWAICGKAVLLETDDLEILKDLVSYVAKKVGMNFYYMSLEQVCLDTPVNFDEFDSSIPTLVYIEPGRWLGGKEGEGEDAWITHPSENAETQHQFRLSLSQFLKKSIDEIVASLLKQTYINSDGVIHPFTAANILIVAPYNAQVRLLKQRLPENLKIGTVDKFQGMEAEVVIISMTTSSGDDMPRDMAFLFDRRRLNVAISPTWLARVLGFEY